MAPLDPQTWREQIWHDTTLTSPTPTASPSRAQHHDSDADASRSSSASVDRKRSRTSASKTARKSHRIAKQGGERRSEAREDVQELAFRPPPELPASVAQSALFALPREIRDRIYGFCLSAREGVPLDWPSASTGYGMQTGLLRVCQVVHEEAAPLLYCLNRMAFSHPSDANMFVRALSSPRWNGAISHLTLRIKAQDNRLWMPYLTSKDPYIRSLKSDYPNLRELHVLYRSTRWMNSIPPEENMKQWHQDPKLSEIITGLSRIFLRKSHEHKSEHERLFASDSNGPDPTLDSSDAFKHKHYLSDHACPDHPHHPHHHRILPNPPPTIRLTCTFRIPAAHFDALFDLASSTIPPPPPPPRVLDPRNSYQPLQPPASITTSTAESDPVPPPFRGFSSHDLQWDASRGLEKPASEGVRTAKTTFALDRGVLVAMEVQRYEPHRDGTGNRD